MMESGRPGAARAAVAGRASFLSARLLAGLLAVLLAGCGGGSGITPVRTAFNRGVFHYSKGNFEEAIGEYRQALAEDEDDHRSRFNLAMALEARAAQAASGQATGGPALAKRLREEAERHYRLLLAKDAGDLRAAVNLAAREKERGLRPEAFARLRSLIENHPRAPLPRVALASHLLGEGGERREEAFALLSAALEEDPASLEANMLLGDARASRGEHDLAREAYRRALKRSPSDLATLLALGRLEVKAGELAAAAACLRRALFVDPDHFQAHLILAGVREAQGDLEGATGHLWRARELDAGGEAAAAGYRRRLLDLYRRLLEREDAADRAAEQAAAR